MVLLVVLCVGVVGDFVVIIFFVIVFVIVVFIVLNGYFVLFILLLNGLFLWLLNCVMFCCEGGLDVEVLLVG